MQFKNKSVILYLSGIFSLLPGIVVGSLIVIPWYLYALKLFAEKKVNKLIIVFILWNYISRGAYHYSLLGGNLDNPIITSFNIFVLFLLFILVINSNNRINKLAKIILWNFFLLVMFSTISSIINNIGLNENIVFILINFRWLLFGLIIILANISFKEINYDLNLVLSIIIINSLFAVAQQLFLPVKVTPDGYMPDYFDLASGFFGVTYSQNLSILCISFAFYFILRNLYQKSNSDTLIIILLLSQPFVSSSKAAIVITGTILLIFMIYFLYKLKIRINVGMVLLKTMVITSILIIGINVYNSINSKVFGNVKSATENYLKNINQFDDISKIQGYLITINEYNPKSNGGILFGSGPNTYYNLSGFYRSGINYLKYNMGDVSISSVDQKNTELVGIIGETGLLSFLIYLLFYIYVYSYSLKNTVHFKEFDYKLISYFSSFFTVVIMVYSFYQQGIGVAFYYIPLFILLKYQNIISQEYESTNQSKYHYNL